MRVTFPLPALLVASAVLGGLLAPFTVGSVPTDGKDVAATERLFGADIPICHGPASAGVTRSMLRQAQTRTEVPQAEMQAASPAAAFADTDPPLWEGLGAVTYKITTAKELAQSYFNQGLRLASKASPREQALIAAVATRYAKDAKADRAPLDAAYASAMEKVAAQFPDDNEIAVLYVESVIDLSPWNYWQPGGHAPNQQSGPIVPTLERVL